MIRVVALVFAWLCFAADASAGGGRFALVIGNSDYPAVGALTNPVNDATDFAAALTGIGFEVILEVNLDGNHIRDSLRRFSLASSGAEIALIYFAGHGIEIDRENYLIPVDATLETERQVAFEGIPMNLFEAATAGATRLRIVLLDACRNNPFLAKMQRDGVASRSLGSGLSDVEPPSGSVVAFSARGGTTAFDGSGRNSPFMAALLNYIDEPGLEINLMFRKVRDSVMALTANRQEPFVYGSLPGEEIYLVPPLAGAALAATAETSAAEDSAWASVAETNDASLLQAFMFDYPRSAYVPDAIERLRYALAAPAPAGSVAVAPAIPTEMTAAELTTRVQTLLDRAECDPGPVDGAWGRKSRQALASFGLSGAIVLSSLEPTYQTLVQMQQARNVTCVERPDANCVVASITVKDSSFYDGPWDKGDDFTSRPDLKFTEVTSGAEAICGNALQCQLRLSSPRPDLEFRIIDTDVPPDTDDHVGSATCSRGDVCTAGKAEIKVRGC